MLSVYDIRRENLRTLAKQWDDPLADIRRGVRWAVGIGVVALGLGVANLLH